MLIRADTFGGDSHNISEYISNIDILSWKTYKEAPFKIVCMKLFYFYWRLTLSPTHQQKCNMLENSPFLNHPCCCCHEWGSLPVAGIDLVFCFVCSEHNPYFHFLYLSCFEYTFTFFLQAVSKYLVFSGNFRCASLTLVRLVTPVHCLQLASIVIDISLPRLHNTQGPGKSQLRAGRRTRSVRVFRVTVSDKLRLTERILHLQSWVWYLLVCPSCTWATAYWPHALLLPGDPCLALLPLQLAIVGAATGATRPPVPPSWRSKIQPFRFFLLSGRLFEQQWTSSLLRCS